MFSISRWMVGQVTFIVKLTPESTCLGWFPQSLHSFHQKSKNIVYCWSNCMGFWKTKCGTNPGLVNAYGSLWVEMAMVLKHLLPKSKSLLSDLSAVCLHGAYMTWSLNNMDNRITEDNIVAISEIPVTSNARNFAKKHVDEKLMVFFWSTTWCFGKVLHLLNSPRTLAP
jgi:hypothetical protein